MSNYGTSISKKGINLPAKNKDLVYTSKTDTLKYLPKYSGTVEYTDGNDVEISHNLGYTPGYLAWRKQGSPARWVCDGVSGNLRADTNKLYIPGVASGAKVHYIIMVNPVVGGPLPVTIGNGTGMKSTTRSINVASMNALDLSFYSEYAHLYTVKEFTSDYTISDSEGTSELGDGGLYTHSIYWTEEEEHGLTYTPGFVSYFSYSANGGDTWTFMNPFGDENLSIAVYVDATKIYYELAYYTFDFESTHDFPSYELSITTKLLGVKLE